jgi:hypothetical protein
MSGCNVDATTTPFSSIRLKLSEHVFVLVFFAFELPSRQLPPPPRDAHLDVEISLTFWRYSLYDAIRSSTAPSRLFASTSACRSCATVPSRTLMRLFVRARYFLKLKEWKVGPDVAQVGQKEPLKRTGRKFLREDPLELARCFCGGAIESGDKMGGGGRILAEEVDEAVADEVKGLPEGDFCGMMRRQGGSQYAGRGWGCGGGCGGRAGGAPEAKGRRG